MKKGDLVYIPSETMLLQYNKEVENIDIDPNKTYIGPAPIKWNKLTKPASLLLVEESSRDGLAKVWFEGAEWFVSRKDIRE